MKKSFAFPIIFMIVITAVFTMVLAYLNYATVDQIAFNEQTELRKTLLYVFDIDMPSDEPKEIEKIFNKYVDKEKVDDEDVYYIEENNQVTGYAFPISGTALWGTVQGYAAISEDYSELLGIDFVAHNETPGLGGRITEAWFKEQFRGLKLDDAENYQYAIYKPSPGGNVDAIAGATQTSNSVGKLLNDDIREFINKRKGE